MITTFLAQGVNYLFGARLKRARVCLAASLVYLGRKRTVDRNYFDQIRLSSLELVSHEIRQKNLGEGAVAELGVYKGKFAQYINFYFRERTLYLFDTFTGFDRRDTDVHEHDFGDTSIRRVMYEMPYPEQCVIKQGYFPDTTFGLEDEKFVFVDIDVDLFQPTLAGLEFFYYRLVKGGYIFIDGFNDDTCFNNAARRAVEQFCMHEGINYFPLSDLGGSAIIMK